LITPQQYVEGFSGTFNYVWNSPARNYFNPIEMSYQAPFVDAAASVDPVNRGNMFISYYSYGSVLGLALDLSLRENGLNLDDFMKLVWKTYGKTQIPYTVPMLHESLNQYAGEPFGEEFFNNYIYKSHMPDYQSLLKSVGVTLKQNTNEPYLGVVVSLDGDGNGEIKSNPKMGSAAYEAELDDGDVITVINENPFPSSIQFDTYLKQFKVADTLKIDFERFGQKKNTNVVLKSNPSYIFSLLENEGGKPSQEILKNRKSWLSPE
ncbi:MAG: PDZ domain-containing protein, partial [Maribacter sp.]